MNNLTQLRLKELLDYDSVTGIFVWKISRGSNALAGSVAGFKNWCGYLLVMVDRKIWELYR